MGKIKRIESRELFEEFTEKDFTLPGIYEHSVYAVEKKHIVSLYLVATEFLTEIEEETVTKISTLTHLVYLCLNICKIPNKFPILPNLSKLFLLSCTINPETIFNELYELEDLTIIDSYMPTLPKSVYDLDLCYLNISVYRDSDREYFQKNCLTTIPNDLGKLQNLRELHIHKTSMKEIPNSIGKLKNLEILYITSCGIAKLPEPMGNLKSLEELVLTDNRISEFPSTFFGLSNLKLLSIGHNNIINIPKQISNFKMLEELLLFHNPIEFIPKELEDLNFLKKIIINKDKDQLLPEKIKKKEKEEILEISRWN